MNSSAFMSCSRKVSFHDPIVQRSSFDEDVEKGLLEAIFPPAGKNNHKRQQITDH